MKNEWSDTYFENYISSLSLDIKEAFKTILKKDFTKENFNFYTAVSVMSSSKIEGETLEIDSYLKHRLNQVEYLPNLTQKPDDLFEAYEFAKENKLNQSNFLKAHSIATKHLLSSNLRGVVRTGNMVIMDHKTGNIQYEAINAAFVKQEFKEFWSFLDSIILANLELEKVFYYASLIHLIFVKIHPFNDGNGRTARLLEKWFLANKLGDKAWSITSELYYYNHIHDYYKNLGRVGLFYEDLNYNKALPFLLMLTESLRVD